MLRNAIIPIIVVALIVIFRVIPYLPESIKKMKFFNNPFVVFFFCAFVATFGALSLTAGVRLGKQLAPALVTLFGLAAIVLPIIITLRENKK